MEDPWANAWGEPAKSIDQPYDAWSPEPKATLGVPNNEIEIAVPSWATGAGVQWSDELSDDKQEAYHPDDEPIQDWSGGLELHKHLPDSVQNVNRTSSPEVAEGTASLPVSLPTPPEQGAAYILPTEDATDLDARPPRATPPPNDPDAFGTFETGLDADKVELDPWAHSVMSATLKVKDTWASSHPAHNHIETKAGEGLDAWEVAKRYKEKQDQHVPPQILASIHSEFQSFSSLWPSISPQSGESTSIADRQSGIVGVEGLSATINRLIPQDLTLPPIVQFPTTFTGKHMGDALRLTRHVPIVRLSPFNMYLSSKGSTAWESSVKSKVETVNDDLLPSGWRVMGKDKEEAKPEVDTKKKVTGGLLSFFGRKPSTTSSEDDLKRPESPSQEPPKSLSTTAYNVTTSTTPTHSSRPSIDGLKSAPLGSSSSSSSLSILPDLTISSAPSVQSPTTSPDQAPSAVSRFLTRFSRNKTSGSSPRNSLALSTDDIEFLSDIVPSANEDLDEASQLRELSGMLSSPPLPAGLPSPLAPPPSAPSTSSFRNTQSTTKDAPQQPISDNDTFALFDSSPSLSQPVSPSSSSFQPPIAGTPIPPSNQKPFKMDYRATNSLTRSGGRSSPSNVSGPSTVKLYASTSGKRTPVAIMSTGSSSNKGDFFTTLPPPPILPPPPNGMLSTRTTHSHNMTQKMSVDEDFTSFHELNPSTSQSSLRSETVSRPVSSQPSLISHTPKKAPTKGITDLFDDFDDFVSSPNHDSSPPRLPIKPAVSEEEQQFAPVRASSPIYHPSQPSHQTSHPTNHQHLMSAVTAQIRPWTPSRSSPSRSLSRPNMSTARGSNLGAQQMNGQAPELSSHAPLSTLPPPPNFSALQTSTMSAKPLPHVQATPSSSSIAQRGHPQPPTQAKHTPSPSPASVASSGLSAQDLSFFEGL